MRECVSSFVGLRTLINIDARRNYFVCEIFVLDIYEIKC